MAGRVTAPRATPASVGSLESSSSLVVNESETEQTADGTIRWVQGFGFWPEDCSGGNRIAPCSDTTEPAEDTPGADRLFEPYLVTASVTCGTFGVASDALQSEYRERAIRKLRAVRSALIEAELWSGTTAVAQALSDNPYLREATGSSILEGGAPMGFATALAELEQAIADQSDHERGTIHAQPRTVSHWVEAHLVHREGDVLLTELGTIVVAGRGYPGNHPEAVTHGLYQGNGSPDDAWAYATGPIELRLGPLDTRTTDGASMVNRTTNELKITAQQFAAATWTGCILVAAHVDNSVALSDTGS